MKKKKDRIQLQMKQTDLEKRITSIETVIEKLDLQIQETKIMEQKLTYEKEKANHTEELNKLKLELIEVKNELEGLKYFNREQCLTNIDLLLEQKNKKLGILETNSGNRPGYLSRMKSGKSNSDPSIEFLLVASDELEVPLDLLVSANWTYVNTLDKKS